jgi:putative acetyltransferase
MEALLDLADNTLGLKRVELDVITDNAAAIHLYESLGFEREGIKRCALFRGGVFVDLLMMGRIRELPYLSFARNRGAMRLIVEGAKAKEG